MLTSCRLLIACAALVAPCAPAAQAAPDTESADGTWGARFQTTYVWQRHPGFAAAYSGPNSLAAEREKSYTFTATAYLGARVWRGGELYFNPEVTQGVPFSNLTGTAGFSNGEITRAAGTTPKLYRQRLFLRQTWNLGGGTEALAAEANQLAGVVDRNRLVLTLGNFSSLDVFDDNAYAKDPRTQFMNWGAMSHAAYDYAADARGFGWGGAVEWYRDDWVLRVGRMTGPREPNMLPLDFRIGRHYGDQFEVEHAHALYGQPGKLRVLAWRNRAVLARYDDALAYGNAVGWAPDPVYGRQYIFLARTGEQTKYGLGVNLEQALSDTVGVFARAMRADGRTETHAFTEADGSFALGLSFNGAAWSRGRDSAGLGLFRNTLSRDRRQYLEAGGISFFIGDGALRYRPETTAEAYYSWSPTRNLWLTADLQRIRNPAYNAERGPVTVAGVRLHAEF